MAYLSDEQRKQLWAKWMEAMSSASDPCALTKPELRAAVDAVDVWVEDNMASFNQALPEPARSQLTPNQKTRLLVYVTSKRWEVN